MLPPPASTAPAAVLATAAASAAAAAAAAAGVPAPATAADIDPLTQRSTAAAILTPSAPAYEPTLAHACLSWTAAQVKVFLCKLQVDQAAALLLLRNAVDGAMLLRTTRMDLESYGVRPEHMNQVLSALNIIKVASRTRQIAVAGARAESDAVAAARREAYHGALAQGGTPAEADAAAARAQENLEAAAVAAATVAAETQRQRHLDAEIARLSALRRQPDAQSSAGAGAAAEAGGGAAMGDA
jgi:hypothetical protein